MTQAIRHAKSTKPRLVPYNGDVDAVDVDRVQSLTGATNQPIEMLYELGREDAMVVDKQILDTSCSMTQLEYGSIDTFLALANLSAVPSGGISLDDFSGSKVDMYMLGKADYEGALEQILWLPKLVLDSFSLSIADPEAKIERSFDLSGDKFRICREGNKYLLFKKNTVPSGYATANYDITVNDPVPVIDPNNAGVYILRVWRVRAGVASDLVLTTDYTWNNGTKVLKILSATTGDVIKYVYTASSWGTAGDPTSLNDVDDYYLKASYVTVSLESVASANEVTLDRLTSLDISTSLNRIEESVIGSEEKIINEIESKEVAITLDGRVKNSTLEEVLMGQAGNSWGIIDADDFVDDLVLRVKVFSDASKTTFLIGYKCSNVFFTDESQDGNANEFWTEGVSLQSDNLIISDVEADIDA